MPLRRFTMHRGLSLFVFRLARFDRSTTLAFLVRISRKAGMSPID